MGKANIHKIDLLLKYILAVAGQEDWESRQLGPIHLIKYLYLADLAYAERKDGETFTGLTWYFPPLWAVVNTSLQTYRTSNHRDWRKGKNNF